MGGLFSGPRVAAPQVEQPRTPEEIEQEQRDRSETEGRRARELARIRSQRTGSESFNRSSGLFIAPPSA